MLYLASRRDIDIIRWFRDLNGKEYYNKIENMFDMNMPD